MTDNQKLKDCIEAFKKLRGIGKYNTPSNLLYNDGYFSQSIRNKYPDHIIKQAELILAGKVEKKVTDYEASDELIFVGYTNGYQILYASESEGLFYNNTENECYIPLYMLRVHEHRLQNTTEGNVTLDKVKTKRKPIRYSND